MYDYPVDELIRRLGLPIEPLQALMLTFQLGEGYSSPLHGVRGLLEQTAKGGDPAIRARAQRLLARHRRWVNDRARPAADALTDWLNHLANHSPTAASLERSRRFYQALRQGPVRPILINHLPLVRRARAELSAYVPAMRDSGAAHGVPPDVLAAVALANILRNAGEPSYPLRAGVGLAQSNSDRPSRWDPLLAALMKSPLGEVRLQDRVADAMGGLVRGASPTFGVLQIRAGPTDYPSEWNVKRDGLWLRWGIDASTWSNRRINRHLADPQWNIEAGAALYGRMIRDGIALQRQGKITGLPDLARVQADGWLHLGNDLPAHLFGPDLLLGMTTVQSFEAPYRVPLDPLWSPYQYFVNGLTDWPGDSLPHARVVAMEAGLFDQLPAQIVGLHGEEDLPALFAAAYDPDDYLRAAARRTIRQLATAREYRGTPAAAAAHAWLRDGSMRGAHDPERTEAATIATSMTQLSREFPTIRIVGLARVPRAATHARHLLSTLRMVRQRYPALLAKLRTIEITDDRSAWSEPQWGYIKIGTHRLDGRVKGVYSDGTALDHADSYMEYIFLHELCHLLEHELERSRPDIHRRYYQLVYNRYYPRLPQQAGYKYDYNEYLTDDLREYLFRGRPIEGLTWNGTRDFEALEARIGRTAAQRWRVLDARDSLVERRAMLEEVRRAWAAPAAAAPSQPADPPRRGPSGLRSDPSALVFGAAWIAAGAGQVALVVGLIALAVAALAGPAIWRWWQSRRELAAVRSTGEPELPEGTTLFRFQEEASLLLTAPSLAAVLSIEDLRRVDAAPFAALTVTVSRGADGRQRVAIDFEDHRYDSLAAFQSEFPKDFPGMVAMIAGNGDSPDEAFLQVSDAELEALLDEVRRDGGMLVPLGMQPSFDVDPTARGTTMVRLSTRPDVRRSEIEHLGENVTVEGPPYFVMPEIWNGLRWVPADRYPRRRLAARRARLRAAEAATAAARALQELWRRPDLEMATRERLAALRVSLAAHRGAPEAVAADVARLSARFSPGLKDLFLTHTKQLPNHSIRQPATEQLFHAIALTILDTDERAWSAPAVAAELEALLHELDAALAAWSTAPPEGQSPTAAWSLPLLMVMTLSTFITTNVGYDGFVTASRRMAALPGVWKYRVAAFHLLSMGIHLNWGFTYDVDWLDFTAIEPHVALALRVVSAPDEGGLADVPAPLRAEVRRELAQGLGIFTLAAMDVFRRSPRRAMTKDGAVVRDILAERSPARRRVMIASLQSLRELFARHAALLAPLMAQAAADSTAGLEARMLFHLASEYWRHARDGALRPVPLDRLLLDASLATERAAFLDGVAQRTRRTAERKVRVDYADLVQRRGRAQSILPTLRNRLPEIDQLRDAPPARGSGHLRTDPSALGFDDQGRPIWQPASAPSAESGSRIDDGGADTTTP
jgi:hypothetical protein